MEDLNDPRRAIEAILMVADDPVEPHLLAQLLELAPTRVEQICAQMAAAYEAERRGFVLVRVAGGYRFQSAPDLAPYLERFVLEGQSARLSSAALETLAIVAYKQPLSRAQVAAIRGVNVDGVMRTLQQRGYIDEVGRDPGPGQATLFGTTQSFLTKLGIDSVKDLPALGAFVPGPEVMEALEHGLRVHPDDGAAEVLTDDDDPDPAGADMPVRNGEGGSAVADTEVEPGATPQPEPEPGAETAPEHVVDSEAEEVAGTAAEVVVDPEVDEVTGVSGAPVEDAASSVAEAGPEVGPPTGAGESRPGLGDEPPPGADTFPRTTVGQEAEEEEPVGGQAPAATDGGDRAVVELVDRPASSNGAATEAVAPGPPPSPLSDPEPSDGDDVGHDQHHG